MRDHLLCALRRSTERYKLNHHLWKTEKEKITKTKRSILIFYNHKSAAVLLIDFIEIKYLEWLIFFLKRGGVIVLLTFWLFCCCTIFRVAYAAFPLATYTFVERVAPWFSDTFLDAVWPEKHVPIWPVAPQRAQATQRLYDYLSKIQHVRLGHFCCHGYYCYQSHIDNNKKQIEQKEIEGDVGYLKKIGWRLIGSWTRNVDKWSSWMKCSLNRTLGGALDDITDKSSISFIATDTLVLETGQ